MTYWFFYICLFYYIHILRWYKTDCNTEKYDCQHLVWQGNKALLTITQLLKLQMFFLFLFVFSTFLVTYYN